MGPDNRTAHESPAGQQPVCGRPVPERSVPFGAEAWPGSGFSRIASAAVSESTSGSRESVGRWGPQPRLGPGGAGEQVSSGRC